MCELGIRLRDLRDVSAILDTHGIEYVRFIASTYAGYAPNSEVMLMEEKDRLCLINTKIMMLREGRIIFNGSDEETLHIRGQKHPGISVTVMLIDITSNSIRINLSSRR